MRHIGVLHLTDFHCGAPRACEPLGDAKDTTVSTATKNELVYQTYLDGFADRSAILLKKKLVHAIAYTGDLGHQYARGKLEEGAIYLKKLAGKLGVDPKYVIVCPGNHDLCQTAKLGKELSRFVATCKKHGFSYPDRTTPATLRVEGMPVIGLNTCLGGTEHALHALPSPLMEKIAPLMAAMSDPGVLKDLPKVLRDQLECLDIPLVGKTQMNQASEFLLEVGTKAVLVLGHHSILPTPNVEIRPYSRMVDAGRLLYQLIEQGRRVVYLHGHSHCDCAFVVQRPDDELSGLFASIGGGGMHGDSAATATYLQLMLDDDGDLLGANVFPFIQKGSDFSSDCPFEISVPTIYSKIPDLDLSQLDRKSRVPFNRVAALLGRSHDDQRLPEDLLRLRSTAQVEITGVTESPSEWNVTRLYRVSEDETDGSIQGPV